jgi:hypothetical protein
VLAGMHERNPAWSPLAPRPPSLAVTERPRVA